MQLQNYFYFNGIPYDQLSFSHQKKIDLLIKRIKCGHLFERLSLYQDHFFNIVQEANNRKLQRHFESDLPDDLTSEIVKAYLQTTGEPPTIN